MTSLSNALDLTLADFRLIKKLGEGAGGVVYFAHQLSFDRDAAVKVLFKHMADSPKMVERFYREARLAGRLDHPHIVQGYAVGEDQGWHYFGMEYVDGQSLQKWLEQLGRFALGDALHIALAIARALDYAHGQNLVHRDIKPGNVLIGRGGEVKVADFGVAKIREEDLLALTRTGRGLGTPRYMPLEQFVNAKEADARCDIYALGCTLYALLTGQPPFTAGTFVELVQLKEAGDIPAARRVNPEVPERLDAIIARMVAKRPADRYANCAEVIAALEDLKLARTQLRLEVPAEAPVPPRGKPTSSVAADAPTSPACPATADYTGVPLPAPPVEASTAPTLPRLSPEAADVWHVTYTPADGTQDVRWQPTTAQLLQWIASKDFVAGATARRGAEGEGQPLAAFRELRAAVLDRVSAKAAVPETLHPPKRPPETGHLRRPGRNPDTVRQRAAGASRTTQEVRRAARAAPPAAPPLWRRALWLSAAVAAGAAGYLLMRFLAP